MKVSKKKKYLIMGISLLAVVVLIPLFLLTLKERSVEHRIVTGDREELKSITDEEEIKELLASAKYPDRVQIKPTESTTKKHSKNSSVVSFKGLFYAGFFVLIIVVAMIKRRVANPRDKSNVISIRMADSDTDDGDDSDAEEDSSDKEKE